MLFETTVTPKPDRSEVLGRMQGTCKNGGIPLFAMQDNGQKKVRATERLMKDKPGLQIIGTENQGQSFINIFTNGLIDLNPSDLEQLAEGLGKRYPRFGGWLAITQERGITLRIIGPKFMG